MSKYVLYMLNAYHIFITVSHRYTSNERYINRELCSIDISQKLALRPKGKVQSASFSEKQFILHCAIAALFYYLYHFYQIDDTKGDEILHITSIGVNEFDLQIIRIFVDSCLRKGAIAWVSSFGVKTF